jgi:hypothetical protein
MEMDSVAGVVLAAGDTDSQLPSLAAVAMKATA